MTNFYQKLVNRFPLPQDGYIIFNADNSYSYFNDVNAIVARGKFESEDVYYHDEYDASNRRVRSYYIPEAGKSEQWYTLDYHLDTHALAHIEHSDGTHSFYDTFGYLITEDNFRSLYHDNMLSVPHGYDWLDKITRHNDVEPEADTKVEQSSNYDLSKVFDYPFQENFDKTIQYIVDVLITDFQEQLNMDCDDAGHRHTHITSFKMTCTTDIAHNDFYSRFKPVISTCIEDILAPYNLTIHGLYHNQVIGQHGDDYIELTVNYKE